MPPALGLLMMLGVFVAHFIEPVHQVFVYPWNYFALLPITIGALLNILADREFRKHGLLDENGVYVNSAQKLVTSGVYQYSRNPAYFGLILITAGLSIWVGSLSPWLVVIAFPWILHHFYVQHEERKLAEVCGERYQWYCRHVRRWISIAKASE